MSEKFSSSNLRKSYFENAMKAFFIQEHGDEETYRSMINILYQMFSKDVKVVSLYRYNSFDNWDNWDRDYLENDKFYLISMDKQNDPFEYAQDTDYKDIMREIYSSTAKSELCNDFIKQFPEFCKQQLNLLEDCFKSIHKVAVQRISEFKSKMSIKCFCEEVDNLLLWSHYANSHTGYCVEYSSTRLFELFQAFLVPVMYENDFPKMHYHENSFNADLNIHYRIATKSKHWEYENEWRIIRACHNEDDHTVESSKPKAIYLGCKVKAEYEKDMIELCRKRNITLYKMKTSHVSYTLEKELIFKGENQ